MTRYGALGRRIALLVAAIALAAPLLAACARRPAGEPAASPRPGAGDAATGPRTKNETPSGGGSVPAVPGSDPSPDRTGPDAPGGSQAAAGTPGPPGSGAAPAEPVLPAPPELPGVLWVAISNSPGAEPQAALDRASWVYEIEAEGGITRFIAGFWHLGAEKIGPVRSVRSYFLHVLQAHGGPIAHAGASYEALDMLARDRSYQSLDEIYGAGGYFWRSRDRKAPHNLYTSTERLLQAVRDRGLRLSPLPDYPSGEMPGGGPAPRITIDFPNDYVLAEWRWEDGRYVRYQNGHRHDTEGGTPVRADNLLVLVAAHYRDVKGDDGVWRRDVGVIGAGDGYFFAGGRMWQIRWQKASPRDHFRFTAGGQPLLLRPGITWVTFVPGFQAVRISGQEGQQEG